MHCKWYTPALLVLSWEVGITLARLYTNPENLVRHEYDFVIVGGNNIPVTSAKSYLFPAGAAGNVLANRLTENPESSVLLIEAGISNEGFLPSIVPFLAPSMQPQSAATWNYTTTPQQGLLNRTLFYARGRMLGGSSSINFMTYTRASDDEYDLWANITEDEGWSWNNLKQYYLKSEKLVPPADGHNTSGQVNPSLHGYGPIEVSLPGFPTELDNRVIATSKGSGEEFPFNLDIQSGTSIGFGLIQSTIGNGERSSSATAYLDPVLSRSNLDVLIQTQVTKLIHTGTSNSTGLPTFRGVEFAQNATGPRFTVEATKEVILSAGSIGTPQILLLSGIGNRTALGSLGIQTFVDLPEVGTHLQDHPLLANNFIVNSNGTFDKVLRNSTIAAENLEQWNTTKQGLFTDAPANSVGFLRLPANSSILKTTTGSDPAAGPKSAHYEMIFIDGYVNSVTPDPGVNNFMTVYTAVVSPTSLGSVTLASQDPFDFPLIDPAFMTSEFDIATAVEAVKSARRFLSASPWNGYISAPYGDLGNAQTDEEITQGVREGVVTIWHPVSTARMSPKGANWGVVDPDLLVKGVEGLRIVDASIFPKIPAAHTVGPVYIVAERAADLIKASYC